MRKVSESPIRWPEAWTCVLEGPPAPLTRLALMNLLEAMLNVEYLYLRHTSSRTTRSTTMSRDYRYHGHAPIVGFATVTMTWSKTALYFIQGEHGEVVVNAE